MPDTNQSTATVSVGIVVSDPGGAMPLDAVVAAIGSLLPDVRPTRHAALEEALAADPDMSVVALVWSPTTSLAWQLGSAETPERAIATWTDRATALLRAQRRARRRVTLVHPPLLCSDAPRPGLAALARRIGGDPAAFTSVDAQIAEPDPVDLLCADVLLRERNEAFALAQELRSATLGAEIGTAGLTAVVKARAALRENEAEKARLLEERALLRETMAAQLEHHDSVMATLGTERARAGNAETRLRELESRLADHHLQKATAEALQHRFDEASAQRKRRDAIAAAQMLTDARDIRRLQAELARIYASRSWKITEPVRALRRHLGPNSS
ncbi:hypothetical protein [Rhodosalinus sp.]|uniref:hypothetical protein n=1 Tax=Rhodosalinus sp. TaxID=2047741 RepID=UPI00397E3C35